LAPGTASAARRINIQITAAGIPSHSGWVITIETDRHPSLGAHLVVLQFPSSILNADHCLKHLGGDNYALAIQLRGPASPAEVSSLYAKTIADLVSALRDPSENWPATIGIHITNGRVTISIHEHN
jgi:hypothetical protein